MPKRRVLFEEFHLSILVPRRFSDAETRKATLRLSSKRFQVRLKRHLDAFLRSYPVLAKTSVRISR